MTYRVVMQLFKLWFLISLLTVAAEESWRQQNENYKGSRQSPVALNTKSAKRVHLPPIKLLHYNVPVGMTVINDGHTIEVKISKGDISKAPFLQGGNLKGRYEAVGFNFHWGSNQAKGSEHSIDGKKQSMEVHIVHIDTKYGNLENALQYDGGTVILAIQYEAGAQSTSGLNEICSKLPSMVRPNSRTSLSRNVVLQSIVRSTEVKEFFTYSGSLTVSPYTETVTWIVSPKVLTIPLGCLQEFYRLQNSHFKPMVNNSRAIQPLNYRTIYFCSSQKNTNDNGYGYGYRYAYGYGYGYGYEYSEEYDSDEYDTSEYGYENSYKNTGVQRSRQGQAQGSTYRHSAVEKGEIYGQRTGHGYGGGYVDVYGC